MEEDKQEEKSKIVFGESERAILLKLSHNVDLLAKSPFQKCKFADLKMQFVLIAMSRLVR